MVKSRRQLRLKTVAIWAGCLLFGWGLSSVLSPYRWYFPANFELSDFLMGRQDHFHGLYQAAFYLHIICGPIALVSSGILIASGGSPRFSKIHRQLGRVLALLVVFGILPSGLVMSAYAITGPIAGLGFAGLAIATATCALIAIYHAVQRRFCVHRRWAIRVFILLCSPILLRFVSTGMSAAGLEEDWAYQLNAWLCWILPWLLFEIWNRLPVASPRSSADAVEA